MSMKQQEAGHALGVPLGRCGHTRKLLQHSVSCVCTSSFRQHVCVCLFVEPGVLTWWSMQCCHIRVQLELHSDVTTLHQSSRLPLLDIHICSIDQPLTEQCCTACHTCLSWPDSCTGRMVLRMQPRYTAWGQSKCASTSSMPFSV